MRILVTGGAGYIGSHTVKALIEKGHEPIIVDNLIYGHKWIIDEVFKVPFCECSVGDQEVITSIINGSHNCLINTSHEGRFIEGVIHFAAFAYVGESVTNPLKYYRNNVIETINLLELLVTPLNKNNSRESFNIPIVFSSSCATYGEPTQIPILEEAQQNPINPYGRTKLIIENVLKDLSYSSNLDFIILRYFNAAGASSDSSIGELHNPETHLIPLVIEAALEEKSSLKIYGTDYDTRDGTCIRDYIHVSDLADAHVLAIEKLNSNFFKKNNDNMFFERIYNLGNGNGISVREIIKSVEKISGKKVKFKEVARREGDPPILIASAKKAKDLLGWTPRYKEIDQIVKHAYQWYKKNN